MSQISICRPPFQIRHGSTDMHAYVLNHKAILRKEIKSSAVWNENPEKVTRTSS